jgi:hypothetical protein
MVMMYFLRPGIAFENVGLDNDMTIWHQTFIIPIPKVDIPIIRSAMLEFSPKKNDVSEFDRIAQALISDYSKKKKINKRTQCCFGEHPD